MVQEKEQTSTEVKEFLLSIIGNAPYGILSIDLEGNITMTNSLAIELLDKKGEVSDFIGVNVTELTPHIPELHKILIKCLERSRDPFDLSLVSVGEKYLSIRGRNIVHGMIIVIEDVTDETESHKKIIAQIEELKKIDEVKTQFLSITSHELKTPLMPLKSQIQMFLEGDLGECNEKQKLSLDIMLRNTDRLNKLITDILDISQIKAGRLKFKLTKVQLADIINEIIKSINPLAVKANLSLTTKVSALPIIMVDGDRIKQVLTNLLANAIKFTPKNGKIVLEAKKQKDTILVKVEDTGIGIPKEHIGKLFVPFYQIDNSDSRKNHGVGLGLSICKSIVEQHGGKIWVESTLKKGSAFYFTLPLKSVVREKKELFRFPKTESNGKVAVWTKYLVKKEAEK